VRLAHELGTAGEVNMDCWNKSGNDGEVFILSIASDHPMHF
jgi:hypothetical protein